MFYYLHDKYTHSSFGMDIACLIPAKTTRCNDDQMKKISKGKLS